MSGMQLPGVPSRTPSPCNKGVPPIPKWPISGTPGYEEGPTLASQPGYKSRPGMVAFTFVYMVGYFDSPIPSVRTAQQAPILRCIWCVGLWIMVIVPLVPGSLVPGPLPPSIALKELVPIMLAAAAWGECWRDLFILSHSNNSAVVSQVPQCSGSLGLQHAALSMAL